MMKKLELDMKSWCCNIKASSVTDCINKNLYLLGKKKRPEHMEFCVSSCFSAYSFYQFKLPRFLLHAELYLIPLNSLSIPKRTRHSNPTYRKIREQNKK